MSVNWKKSLEIYMGSKWIPCRLIATDFLHSSTGKPAYMVAYQYQDLYPDQKVFNYESSYFCDEKGKWNNLQVVRNAVKKIRLHGAVLRGDRVDEDGRSYVNAPEMLPSEAAIKKLYPNAVGYFSKEIIENDDA